jgi:hypothetical protein
MTTPEHDDRWLDGLAGRGGTRDPSAAEGRVLRKALAARSATASEQPGDARDHAARAQALVERARREGMIPGRATAAPSTTLRYALAAAVAILGAGLAWMVRPAPEAQILRNAPDDIERVAVRDPAIAQAELMAALRSAGVEPRGYEVLGRRGVDAEVPVPSPEAVIAALDRFGLSPPADGVLRVEFAPER